ncbi:hypothetical protein PUN28_010587 [Cardiocondyla obscurior]|uniref:Uncharacterized protein n=1 Tax=Cardiocondyla obscurior TaxID=286306 RepID=A0AAW2FGK7_9HYME
MRRFEPLTATCSDRDIMSWRRESRRSPVFRFRSSRCKRTTRETTYENCDMCWSTISIREIAARRVVFNKHGHRLAQIVMRSSPRRRGMRIPATGNVTSGEPVDQRERRAGSKYRGSETG